MVIIFYCICAFIQTKSRYLYIFISLAPWKEISKAGKVSKLAASDLSNDYFCPNWLKEESLRCLKTVSDVLMQYTLLREIFRKTFYEIFRMQNISQNTVSPEAAL